MSITKHVTVNAVVKRINRKLAQEQQYICRGRNPWGNGQAWLLVGFNNAVESAFDDLGELSEYATDLGVLHPSEGVAS